MNQYVCVYMGVEIKESIRERGRVLERRRSLSLAVLMTSPRPLTYAPMDLYLLIFFPFFLLFIYYLFSFSFLYFIYTKMYWSYLINYMYKALQYQLCKRSFFRYLSHFSTAWLLGASFIYNLPFPYLFIMLLY